MLVFAEVLELRLAPAPRNLQVLMASSAVGSSADADPQVQASSSMGGAKMAVSFQLNSC